MNKFERMAYRVTHKDAHINGRECTLPVVCFGPMRIIGTTNKPDEHTLVLKLAIDPLLCQETVLQKTYYLDPQYLSLCYDSIAYEKFQAIYNEYCNNIIHDLILWAHHQKHPKDRTIFGRFKNSELRELTLNNGSLPLYLERMAIESYEARINNKKLRKK